MEGKVWQIKWVQRKERGSKRKRNVASVREMVTEEVSEWMIRKLFATGCIEKKRQFTWCEDAY